MFGHAPPRPGRDTPTSPPRSGPSWNLPGHAPVRTGSSHPGQDMPRPRPGHGQATPPLISSHAHSQDPAYDKPIFGGPRPSQAKTRPDSAPSLGSTQNLPRPRPCPCRLRPSGLRHAQIPCPGQARPRPQPPSLPCPFRPRQAQNISRPRPCLGGPAQLDQDTPGHAHNTRPRP